MREVQIEWQCKFVDDWSEACLGFKHNKGFEKLGLSSDSCQKNVGVSNKKFDIVFCGLLASPR